MVKLLTAIPVWLADYHLLAIALLLVVTVAAALLRQPAQRLALANATLAALAALAMLLALPGWSLVHLMSESPVVEATPNPAPIGLHVPQQALRESFEPPRTVALAPPSVVVSSPSPPTAQPRTPTSWTAWLVAIYAVGSAAVTLWLLVGAVLAHRVRREATVAPPELQELLRQICGESKSVPKLLLSPRIAAPAALGLRRPAILLPASTFPHPHSQFLPILAHEWAHLQHRDLHTLAASRLLLILLWPQPLFWLLRRTIRLDQETLADAAAADRAGRLDYAQQLLAWARTANTQRPPRLAGAVGLWEGPSQLKRRIALLLNEQFAVMRSCSVAWRRLCIASLAVTALALSLVTLQPSPVAGEDATASATSGEKDAEGSAPANAPASAPPFPKGFTKISGDIVTEDGRPATSSGWLYSDSTTGNNSYTSAEGHFTDEFDAKVHNGTVWLTYFPDGFAPAWAGPLQADGKDLNNISLVLKPGVTITIEVADEAGVPVAGANILALPIIGENSNGPNVERLTNDQGGYEFEHVAALPYKIEVTAPTFQALRLASIEMNVDQPLKLTLKRAQPTTGIIENEDGTPAVGAVVRFRAEVWEGNTNSGGPGYGKAIATADAQGRFTLDSLVTGSSYLYVIETTSGARAWSPEITAGMKDVVIRVPARRDLRGRVVGDFDQLPQRNGKPFVSVSQRHDFKTKSSGYGDLVGEDAVITLSADGGEFTYKGLLPGKVEVAAGEFKTTAIVSEKGVTEAVLQVAPGPNTSAAPPSVSPNPPKATRNPADATAASIEPLVKQLARTPNVFMGYCIDETGSPLAGVDVSLFVYESSANENAEPVARTKSAADGRFEFSQPIDVAKEFPNGVPEEHLAEPPIKIIAAVAQLPGRTTEFQNDALHTFATRGQAAILKMTPAQKLTGRVTDDKGQPVANATVTTTKQSGYVPGDNLRARTDAEGRYVIDDLPSVDAAEQAREHAAARERNEIWGMYPAPAVTLSVQHPAMAAHRVNVKTIPGELDVALMPGSTIKGRVVARGSQASDAPRPLGNIPVWIMRTMQPYLDPNAGYAPVEMQQAKTDAEGNYSFTSLPASEYAVTATAPNLTTVGVKGIVVGAGQTTAAPDVVLSPGAILRMKLVDGATKEPLKLKAGQKAYVLPQRISSGSIEAPRMESQLVAFNADAVGETRVAPGRYNLFVSIPGQGLAPNLESHANGGKSTIEGFECREGETLEIDVPLVAFEILPESGAAVMAPPADAANDAETVYPPAAALPFTPVVPIMSPADGELPGVVPLKAEPTEKRDIQPARGADDAPPNPNGTPLDGDVPPPNAIYKPAGAANQLTTDAQLKVELTMAPVGVPIPSTTGAQIAPAQAAPSGAVAETRHQSIGMGTLVAVAAKPAEPSTDNANKLEIKAVDEQGAPLADVEALIYRAPPHNAPGRPVLLRTLATDADGKLLVPDLVSAEEVARFQKIKADGGFLGGLEGGFLIALRRPGLATAAFFQAAGPLGLYGADRTIKMRPAAKLSGQVTDPAGKPVAGATVIAGGDFFGGVAIEGVNAAVTDADGRYEFADRAAFNRAEANKRQNQSLAMATAALDFKTSPQAQAPAPAEDPSVNSVSDLLVSHPDYAFTRIEGGDVPGVVEIKLLPAASITGRVIRHGNGAAAAGVIVHADGFPNGQKTDFPSHTSGHSAVTTTDARGAYRIANLPAGRYDVWADAGAREMSDAPWVSRGHGRIKAMPGGEPAQVPDLVIGAPAVVQVQLVDAESGKPVELPAGALVTVGAESVDGPRLQLIPQQLIAAATDGRFEMRLLPGRSRVLLFVHEGGLGSRAIWQTDDDVNSTGKVFDVTFGETTSATIPVLPTRRIEELRERDMAAYKLIQDKKYAEAIAAYTALIADFPKNHFRVLQQRGHAYNRLGDFTAALADFEASLKLAPDDAVTKFWIAGLLATTPVDADRDSRRALQYVEQIEATARTQDDNQNWLASLLDIQAAAHADLGDFEKAIKSEQEAIQFGNPSQRKEMESRLKLYEDNKPYRLSPPASAP